MQGVGKHEIAQGDLLYSLDGDTLSYKADSESVDQTAPATSILIAGDLCMHGRPEALLSHGQGVEVWGEIPAVTAVHDLNLVNLECPLTRSGKHITKIGPHLRSDPRCAAAIRVGGFQVVTLANNHIMDYGVEGLQDTLQACRAAGLLTVGAGANLAQATRTLPVCVKNLDIAVLSLAEEQFSIATDQKAGAWPLDLIDNYRQLAEAREQADFAVVVLHGGNEGYPLPSPRLIKVCRFLADVGAGAVICHHSHLPSGMEVFHGVPIIYGTGNFLFDKHGKVPSGWHTGYAVSLQLRNKRIAEVRLIPYNQCRGRPRIELMHGREAATFLNHILSLSNVIQDVSAIQRAWKDYSRERQGEYLGRLIAWNSVEERLWSRQLLPMGLIRGRLPNWLELIACQAHHEVLLEVLRESVDEME